MSERKCTDTTETAEDDREQKGGWSVSCWAIALLLLFYPLSVGPVAKFGQVMRPVVPRGIVIFYSPIGHLYNSSPAVKRFYDWYLNDLWKVK